MYKASSRCLRVIAENTPVRVNIAPIPAKIYAVHLNAFIDLILQLPEKSGDGGSRTPDLVTASHTLWPTELNPRINCSNLRENCKYANI